MAQFVVRHIEDDVVEQLKKRAKRHARSMEAEVRDILRAAVRGGAADRRKLGSRIAGRFRRVGLREDLPERRGTTVRAAEFDS